MSAPAARIFSPVRILALALNTLTELARLKIFYFLLIFALLVIGNSLFMAKLSFEQELQMLKDVALGAMAIFTSLIAILATATLLPKDIEDRTVYTILSKPVPRYEYLAGKLLGILLLLGITTLVMSALFCLVLWVRESTLIGQATAQFHDNQLSREELDIFISQVKTAGFNVNLIPGIATIFFKASLLASLTLLITTFATSSIFAMIISIAIYFIGHLQATARGFWLGDVNQTSWLVKALLAIVALLFPDLQAFSLTDIVVAGDPISLTITLQTAALGAMYVVIYFLLSCFIFQNREL